MWLVLVYDCDDVSRVFGPFATEADASAWADARPDYWGKYTTIEMEAP